MDENIAKIKAMDPNKRRKEAKLAARSESFGPLTVAIVEVNTTEREDAGADTTIISEERLDRVKEITAQVKEGKLDSPIELQLVVQAAEIPKVEVTQEATTYITIYLPGSGIPVLRNVKMLVTGIK